MANPAESVCPCCGDERGEHDPRAREAGVEAPARPDSLGDRPECEHAVVEHDEHGRDDDRLLAGGARQTGEHCDRRPLRRRALERANARVHREQQAHGHHRLGALGRVVDDLARERVHRPDERDGQREAERAGRRRLPAAQPLRGPPDDAEDQQRADEMQRDVHDVVARDVEAADRVVDREREIDQRPARERRVDRRRQHRADVPQLADLRVLDDGGSGRRRRTAPPGSLNTPARPPRRSSARCGQIRAGAPSGTGDGDCRPRFGLMSRAVPAVHARRAESCAGSCRCRTGTA